MKHPAFSKYAPIIIILFEKERPKYIVRIAHKILFGVLGVRDRMYD